MFAPDEVFLEIRKVDDDLHEWVNARRFIFFPLDVEIQAAAKAVLKSYPRLVDTKRGRSQADPFVIACAQVKSAIVVTEEDKRENPGKSPKIPDVYEALGIPYMNTLDFIRKLGL